MGRTLNFFLLISIFLPGIVSCYGQSKISIQKKEISILKNEKWWGGAVLDGRNMPFGEDKFVYNQDGDCKTNQAAPLFLSNKGRYIWSEKPLNIEITVFFPVFFNKAE